MMEKIPIFLIGQLTIPVHHQHLPRPAKTQSTRAKKSLVACAVRSR
jgi:hypothetical protein